MRNQARVLALADGKELVVSSALYDSAAGEDDDLVAVANRREPVGDDQAGAAAAAQVVVDDRFGLRVERAGGFVENQQAGITHQGPGDLQSLALAAGEIPPLLADNRAVAAPALQQVAVDRRVDRCLDKPVGRNHLVPERQVFADRAFEETDVRVDQLDGVDKNLARQLARRACRRRGSRRSRAGRARRPGGRSSIFRFPSCRPAQCAGRGGQRTRNP